MSVKEFDARHYWDKRLGKEWSLHGVGMSKVAHSYNRWMYRVRRDVFQRTVGALGLDRNNANVLDIGSGTGFYIDLWRRFGARRVTGVDIADSAVEQLRGKFPDVDFTRADIAKTRPFEPESFDAVSAFDVLFHIVDDEGYRRAFSNVHEMLRPGGAFVFTENFLHGKQRGHTSHFVSHSLNDIKKILHETGFEIVSRRPSFVLMAEPVDSPQRRKLWNKRLRPLIRGERGGNLVGAALYPIELLLTRTLKESDTVEVMVARKKAGANGAAKRATAARNASGATAGQPAPSLARRAVGLLAKAGLAVTDVEPGSVLLSRSGRSDNPDFTVAKPEGLGPVVTKGRTRARSLARGAALVTRPQVAAKNTFEIHKALHKQMTNEHVAEILQAYQADCVLDVGANTGQYARGLREAGYKGHIISFEPVPEIAEKLRRKAKNDPKWTVQECALGREDTTMTMNVVSGSMSSILPPSDYGNGRYKRFKNISSVEVPVRRLDGLLDEILPAELERPRLYLKLDTQGYDVEVFAGLAERVRDFVGMQSEVAVLQIYEGMPRMDEAIVTFEAQGFEITGMFPVTRETTTGRVLEFDCILARAESLTTEARTDNR